jgi:hypothetical protein
MIETTLPPLEPPRRLHFDWLLPALFSPRSAFARIAAYEHGAWLTPLLLLTILALVRVAVAGPIEAARIQSAALTPPPGFETWPPQQQEQFYQSQAQAQGMMTSPVFIYIFPAAGALLGTWIGWLATFGLLHLLLTLLGGRGSTRTAMNVVAWASLPYALREILRIGYLLVKQQTITAPGLSGFAPTGGIGPVIAALLQNVDIYLFWYIALIVLGVTVADKMSRIKALSGVLATMLVLGLLTAAPAALGALFLGATSGGTF